MNLGNLVDKIYEIRSRRLALEQEVQALKEEQIKLELEFQDKAFKENVMSVRGHLASCSITETILPRVEDWDEFYRYIQDTGYYHLLERRPAAGAYRELLDKDVQIPGVTPFTKFKINTRKIG